MHVFIFSLLSTVHGISSFKFLSWLSHNDGLLTCNCKSSTLFLPLKLLRFTVFYQSNRNRTKMCNRTMQASQVLVWRYFSQRILTLGAWSPTFQCYSMGPRRGSSEAGHRGCACGRADIVGPRRQLAHCGCARERIDIMPTGPWLALENNCYKSMNFILKSHSGFLYYHMISSITGGWVM